MGYEREFPWRRVVVEIMVASLALAGGVVVLGALSPEREIVVQLLGTVITTGICALLFLVASKIMLIERCRLTGVFMMILVLVEFLLALMALWRPWNVLWGRLFETEDDILATAISFGLISVSAVVFFHIFQFRGGRPAGLLGLVFCAVGFAVIEIGILHNAVYTTRSGVVIAMFAPLVAACAAGHGGYTRYTKSAGLVAALGACSLMLYGISLHISTNNADSAAMVLLILALLLGQVNLLGLIPRDSAPRWLRIGSIALAWLAGIIFVADYQPLQTPSQLYMGLVSAIAVCAACGSIAIAVLARFNRSLEPPAPSTEFKELAITCPHCRKEQTLAAGDSRCGGCGLEFSIRIHEPRCAICGYLLLMIQSDRCPECGTPVAGERPAEVVAEIVPVRTVLPS